MSGVKKIYIQNERKMYFIPSIIDYAMYFIPSIIGYAMLIILKIPIFKQYKN